MPSEVSTVTGDQSVEALRRELAEAREQQAATADILKVISSSPSDVQRVFAEIAESAARLCDAYDATIHQVDGDLLRLVAHHGPIPVAGSWPLTRGRLLPRAVISRRTIHVADLQAETDEYPEGSEIARRFGYHTILVVPLIRTGVAIGVITIRRTEVRPFADRQIDLLKTFADQAVIAIENTRLFEEVQARTKELQDSLDRQTATSEVLGVISRSPNEVQPVLDAIVATAHRLCQAERAAIWRLEGETFRGVAHCGLPEEWVGSLLSARRPLSRGSMVGRATLARRAVQVEDVATDPELIAAAHAYHRAGNIHTVLAVPLLLKDHPIGVITLARTRVAPFDDKQVALVESFADQAVIAIENTRLFEAEQTRTKEVEAKSAELRESLEYQTATSEVLSVISRSPNDVKPVLDTIARIAQRLCQAEHAFVLQREEEGYRLVAANDALPDWVSAIKATPLLPERSSVTGRVALERRTVHIDDLRADPEYKLGPTLQHGVRSELGVPLMRDGEVIGVIIVGRTEVRPFTDRQIDLLKTFADQAVIAIANTRLFEAEQASKRELTEALEQQTATADVLKVISRSALDVQKVLDALVESAARLCDAYDAAILKVFGDSLRLVAHHGQIPTIAPIGQLAFPLLRGFLTGRAVIDRRTIHVADILAEGDEFPEGRKGALQLGTRTALAVPLVHAGEAIGVIYIRRGEVRPFTERQIELVNTFADQAVIAIENTRLFEEVQARTRELAKTVEDLEIASQHKNQFVANMSHELRTPLAAILGYAELIQEGFYEPQGPKSLDALTRIRSNGKHLLGLINTVLDIAKIESGQFTLNMTEYAIESVVETVRAATGSLAQNKKLTLTTSVDKSLPVGLGDEQRLTQVLLNLVGNAIKFTDAGEVSIAAGARNGRFAVSVTDTGPGIPLDQQDRIFEQFHQVDSSLTKAKGGTGLGLAIAKQIVEMHGGRIWVESMPGKGSNFQLELPIRAEIRSRNAFS
jgi:signal transduction histidine kinase